MYTCCAYAWASTKTKAHQSLSSHGKCQTVALTAPALHCSSRHRHSLSCPFICLSTAAGQKPGACCPGSVTPATLCRGAGLPGHKAASAESLADCKKVQAHGGQLQGRRQSRHGLHSTGGSCFSLELSLDNPMVWRQLDGLPDGKSWTLKCILARLMQHSLDSFRFKSRTRSVYEADMGPSVPCGHR